MSVSEIGVKTVAVDAEAVRSHIGSLQGQGIDVVRIAVLSRLPVPLIDSILQDRRIRQVRPSVAARILEITSSDRVAGQDDDDLVALAPAIGTVRRLRALVAAGHPRVGIAERMGVPTATVDGVVDQAPARVPAGIARRAVLVFNDLQLVPGTDAYARHYGLEQRWAPPLAWDEDDIDREGATPAPPRRSRDAVSAIVRQERRELVRELAGAGKTTSSMARELGASTRTIQRDLRALGIAESEAS